MTCDETPGSQRRKKRRLIQSKDLGSERLWVSIGEPRYSLPGPGEPPRHSDDHYRENRSPEQKIDCWGVRAPRFPNTSTVGGDF
jgi:hypothetical protein